MTVYKEESFERSGEANVKDWGAIGDGQADDTEAFECAIAHVVNAAAGAKPYLQIHFNSLFVFCGCNGVADAGRQAFPGLVMD